AAVEEVMHILERRAKRDASARMPGQDQMSALVQKAILDYAERAILLRRSQAAWRLGHGNPVTYELLTGGGNLELMVEATRVLRDLVEVQQRFVFVAGEPGEGLFRMIGQDSWLHQERFKFGVSRKLPWDDE